ncbi:MAG: protein kinase [Planctomycetota bacterium]
MSGLDEAGGHFLRLRALSQAERDRELLELTQHDTALANLVRRMLDNEDKTLPLEGVAGRTVSEAEDRSLDAGGVVGPYRIVEMIGEGGFGAVFQAEQSEPVRRTVALKVAKPGVASPALLSRFEAEKQVVAMMNHPGIARLYDAGETPQGLPYFAMELVPGLDIVRYCDRAGLDIEARLRLFIDVCSAITHAHQRGVIHRDLKPSNILVVDEGHPQPKIIDFGIAKALVPIVDSSDAVRTLQGQWLGTPAYMSPEQLTMPSSAVDVRSDVFSLGAILYELLSGTQALGPDAIAAAGLAGLSKLVSEASPAAPSTVAMQTGATTAGRISRDLDWIVLKAIERDRVRRYGSIAEFAQDVRSFLDGLPVKAAPPSAVYRARKFASRHRAALLAGTTVCVGVVIAVGAVVASLISTSIALDKAEAAERVAVEQRGEAVRAKNDLSEATYSGQLLRAREAIAFGQREQAIAALDACEHRLRGPEWRTLWAEVHPEPIAYNGFEPNVAVRGVAFSGDSALLVASSNDQTARVWRTVTQTAGVVYKGHDGMVLAVDVDPTGQYAASVGGMNRELHVWSTSTAKRLARGVGHSTWVTRVLFNSGGDLLATSSDDGTVRVWDANDAAQVSVVPVNEAGLFGLAWHPNGEQLVAAGDDGVVALIDARTGLIEASTVVNPKGTTAVVFSADGSTIAVGANDGTIAVLSGDSLGPISEFAAHRVPVRSLAWHPLLPIIVSGSDRGGVRCHDPDGVLLGSMLATQGIIQDLRIDRRGVSLAASHADGLPRVYDLDRVLRTRRVDVHVGEVVGAASGTAYGSVVSLGSDGRLTSWDVETERVHWSRAIEGYRPMSFHASNGVGLVGFRSGNVTRIDLETGGVIDTFAALEGKSAWRVAPAGDGVAMFDWDAIATFVPGTGRELRREDDPPASAWYATSSSTYRANRDGSVLKDGVTIAQIGEIVSAIAESGVADNPTVFVGTLSGRVFAISASTGSVREFEHAVSSEVRSFAFERETSRVFVFTEDGRTAWAFNWSTGRAVESFGDRQSLIRGILTDASGRRILFGEGVLVTEVSRE